MAVYDREEDAPQVNLYGRKMKLLEVMRILERETDAEHALTANRIAARLEEKGFPHADRKGIYDDINVLNFCRRQKQWNWSARWNRSVPCIRPKG